MLLRQKNPEINHSMLHGAAGASGAKAAKPMIAPGHRVPQSRCARTHHCPPQTCQITINHSQEPEKRKDQNKGPYKRLSFVKPFEWHSVKQDKQKKQKKKQSLKTCANAKIATSKTPPTDQVSMKSIMQLLGGAYAPLDVPGFWWYTLCVWP